MDADKSCNFAALLLVLACALFILLSYYYYCYCYVGRNLHLSAAVQRSLQSLF